MELVIEIWGTKYAYALFIHIRSITRSHQFLFRNINCDNLAEASQDVTVDVSEQKLGINVQVWYSQEQVDSFRCDS